MKIRLEKPVVNILKLIGGKNEKSRLGTLHKKPPLDLYFVYMNGRQSNQISDIWTRGFPTEILLHIYNVQQAEIISGFLFTFISQKL